MRERERGGGGRKQGVKLPSKPCSGAPTTSFRALTPLELDPVVKYSKLHEVDRYTFANDFAMYTGRCLL